MTTRSPVVPVLPVAFSTALRASLAALALVTHWLKTLGRARRHRRDAMKLAGLDRRMLADLGVTHADLRDAFSTSFWEDPTALLRERAIERRLSRSVPSLPGPKHEPEVETGFRRPATDRPARRTL
ncbi:MAG: hypothetical protein IRY89_03565 [Pseudolabrys sp.]|nr:hypothetical protein [Pseudolabrys sp.]